MALAALNIPPGVYRNGTDYQTKGRWFNSQLVRFHAGTLRPFGGWLRATTTAVNGPGRGILAWIPGGFSRQAVIGTPQGLFLWDNDVILAITPAGFPAGRDDTFYGDGYGFGLYGGEAYGISGGAAALGATTWSFDTWGDHVVGCATHDQKIYVYDNDSLPAVVITGAPTALALMVTPERSLVAIGANNDMRRIMWSDHENFTTWTPDVNNAAGDWRFQTDGTLVTGRRVRGANLLFTTTDVHRMDFIGGTLVYRFDLVSQNCGLIAPLAVQVVEGGALWMGQRGFFVYSGGQVQTLDCDIQDYVFGDINPGQAAKFSSGHIAAFSETLFFYCSAASSAINRCVAFNHREKHWTIVDREGLMARGCWADTGAFETPLAVGNDGTLWEHESGFRNGADSLIGKRFIESGPVELGEGGQILHSFRMVPDSRTLGDLTVTFFQRFVPLGAETTRGPYPVQQPYTDIRVTARQVRMRLTASQDTDFRFGVQRLDLKPGGRR